jgi:ring-1,2-phenylacetyl-CoA epoxidase subunit PaaE
MLIVKKITQPLFLAESPCLSILSVLANPKKAPFFTETKHLKTLFHQQLHDFTSSIRKSTFYSFGLSQVRRRGAFGRIDKATVNFVLNNKHKELNLISFTFCGPE